MEVLQSVVKIEKGKPPAEPPPSLKQNTKEIDLYVTDVTSCAEKILQQATDNKINQLKGVAYTPFITAQDTKDNISQPTYRTKHSQVYQLHIPTPKSAHHNAMHHVSVQDKNTLEWIDKIFNPFQSTDITYPSNTKYEQDIIKKWDSMIGKLEKPIQTKIMAA